MNAVNDMPMDHAFAVASVDQLRAAVKNMDALTQEACGGIEALGAGALSCLDFHAGKLEHARALLLLIVSKASELSDLITYQAERVGMDHTDEDREVLLAIWQDKQRALDAALSASAMGETQS